MNMREKIARALLAREYPDEYGGELGDFWWERHGEHYLDMADAVMEVLMEPTKGMMENEDEITLSCWRAMIQAAKEGK